MGNVFWIWFVFFSVVKAQNHTYFELSVIHVNDIHARFEEISPASTRCLDNCIGGFSRMYTMVHQLIKRPNAIFLNAGDSFQGTLWYNLFGWNVTQHFLNMLPGDAYTLGNHEFDRGVEGVVPFIKALKYPTVVANIDDSDEPSMQGIYNKSIVIERSGRQIGIIGVILSSTNEISSTGNLKFTDEVEAINTEAKKLVEDQNCSIIIVVSHCGIGVDRRIAKEVGPHVGLIVGGHSHTFLYSGDELPGPEKPAGPYPVVVTNKDGRKVLIVQASFNTKYVGNLTLWYDEFGNVQKWEGNSIYLNSNVPQDPSVNEEINRWKKYVDIYGNTVLGSSKVLLDRSTRRSGESNIGSFFADAMVDYYVDKAEEGSWTFASIAVINSGSIRTSLFPGNITISDLTASQPFEDTVDCVELTGRIIKDFLEFSVTPSIVRKYQLHEFLQISGLRVVFNTQNPEGSRVVRLKVLCSNCSVPVYSDIKYDEVYRVLMPSFLAGGGDGYRMISENMRNRIVGDKDFDVFSAYVKKRSPITQGLDERIIVVGPVEFEIADDYSNCSALLGLTFFSGFVIYGANFFMLFLLQGFFF